MALGVPDCVDRHHSHWRSHVVLFQEEKMAIARQLKGWIMGEGARVGVDCFFMSSLESIFLPWR